MVTEIVISDLKEGVFFAKIICTSEGKEIEIDARPSDAIAIGLRFDVSIYTNENILTEAGIVLTDEDEPVTDVSKKVTSSAQPENKPKKLEDMPADQLNKLLNDALSAEDYERAAKVRDEINKRN